MRTKRKAKPAPRRKDVDQDHDSQQNQVQSLLKTNLKIVKAISPKCLETKERELCSQDQCIITEPNAQEIELTPKSQAILEYVQRSLQNDEGIVVGVEETEQQSKLDDIEKLENTNLMVQTHTYNESSMFITTSRLENDTSAYDNISKDYGFDNEGSYTDDEEEAQIYNTEGLEVHDHISRHNPWDQSVFDTMNLQVTTNEDAENQYEHNGDLEEIEDIELLGLEGIENIKTTEDEEQTRTQAEDTNNNMNVLSEEDIEIFLENENSTEQEALLEPISSKYIPEVGMQFNSSDEAKRFCNEYAYMAGFSMVVASTYRTLNKSRGNEFTRITLKCNKKGKIAEKDLEPEESIVQERQTSVTAKIGCKCTVVVKEDNGVWKIKTATLDHNHPLGPRAETKFFRTHKYMTAEEKIMIRTLKKVNTPTRNMVAILSCMRGGRANLTYDDKDVANYSYKVGRERTMNDMTQMLQYFSDKQAQNPGFYYSVDMDSENKVRNIFWADAKAREYYATYGDCISFDTTFLTNKYNLPFAPFVGVSAHANTYIFACAFLGDETSETFSWVFEQFLKAMNGKHPKSIITDQDGAMRKAIALLFPGTTHRNCWFHVKKTLEEKLVKVFPKKKGLYVEMMDILDNSLTEAEFEDLWQKMMAEHELHHIKHLTEIWEKRDRFIPVYFKNSFFPFIQSTGRSEGINGVFKKGVGPQYSLMSFLNEFHRISDTIQNREDRMDYHTRNRNRKVLWSRYSIEKQAHELYNKAIFVKFQQQLKETTALCVDEIEEKKTFEVYTNPNQEKQPHRLRKYVVIMNLPEEEYACICCKFKKDGILCSHVLKVMLQLNIKEMP